MTPEPGAAHRPGFSGSHKVKVREGIISLQISCVVVIRGTKLVDLLHDFYGSEKVLKVWWDKQHLTDGGSDFWALPSNEYQAQVIKYFMVNDDLETLYWVVYTDLIPKLELQILEIKRLDIINWVEDARTVEKRYLQTLDEAEKMLENA